MIKIKILQEVEEINTQIIDNNFLSSSFETNYNSSLALRAGLIDDMDWASFAWGFCCWPVGFFVVVTNKDKDSNQKKSFWIGLGTSFVLSLISGAGASEQGLNILYILIKSSI